MQMESRAGGPRRALTNAARQRHTEQKFAVCAELHEPESPPIFLPCRVGARQVERVRRIGVLMAANS